MRKLIAILSAAVMMMTFASCSGNTEAETTANTTAESTTAETTAVSETTTETTTESTTVVTTFKELIETTLEQITTTATTKATTKPTTAKPVTTTAKPTTTTTTAKPTTTTAKLTTTTTTKPETTRPVKGILSDFESWDLYGNTVTQDILKGKKLTMVNFWATFCTPCINEMPDLGEIHREYESKGFQILGVVTDLYSEQAYYTAEEIILTTNATYTHIALSEDLLAVKEKLSTVVPTTIFVDENGVMVGKGYLGSKDKEEWIAIIDSLLEQV